MVPFQQIQKKPEKKKGMLNLVHRLFIVPQNSLTLQTSTMDKIHDGTKFTLSFRHAGGIMADQSRRGETYIDYYWPCRKQKHEAAIVMGRRKGEVGHGVVTELIRRDLETLGFSLSPNNV